MFNMLNFLKNETFYDVGIHITAGEVRDRVRFRHVFCPPALITQGLILPDKMMPETR
jgi:hypothetical protein